VNIEGEEVELANLDIFSEVGYYNALTRKFEQIEVNDGEINIAFSAIKDNAKLSAIEIVNTMDSSDDDKDPSTALRINCGGDEDVEIEGYTFIADKYYSQDSRSWVNEEISDIGNTEYDILYRSERFANRDQGTIRYDIPFDNGDYIIFLHFAEIYFGAEGGQPENNRENLRRMYARIEGQQSFKDLDLIALTGSSNAYIREIPITVSDGELNIEMGAAKNRPKISAIEILPAEDADKSISKIDTRTSLRINCGGEEDLQVDEYTFIADTFFTQTSSAWRNAQLKEVASTPYDELYITERFADSDRGSFNYNIPVANGEYVLFLHFAEIYFGAEGGLAVSEAGVRLIEVTAENQQVITNLDLLDEVGTTTAYVKEIPVVVSDGVLNLNFAATANRPKVSAIELLVPDEAGTSISKVDMRTSLRINCGSSESATFNGYEFMADEYYTETSRGWRNNSLSDVTGTSHDDLYLTERYADQDLGTFSYHVPVENGDYVVYLHFAEIYFGAEGGTSEGRAGMRQFDVTVEDELALDDLDLIGLVGASKAYAKEIRTTVKDGILDINLEAGINRAKISAIEILIPNDAETSISKATNTSRLQEESNAEITLEPSLINLAPNPASGQTRLMIDDERWEGRFEVIIYDMTGRQVRAFFFEKERSMGSYDIDLRKILPGIYIMSLITEQNQISQKLWIN